MSEKKTLVTLASLQALGGKGVINSIIVRGHNDEATCAVLSTIFSYLETSLDNFGVPYSIQCEPLVRIKRIYTQGEDEVAWRLFRIAADMFRAASICEPTRGKVEVDEPCILVTDRNEAEY